MNRPSPLAVLSLFARTALRRLANRSASWKLSRWKAKDSVSATRSATQHRSDQGSGRRRVLGIGLALSFVGGWVMMGTFSLQKVIWSVRLDDMLAREVMPISPEDYQRLQSAAQIPDEAARTEELGRIFSNLLDVGEGWLAKDAEQAARERFHAIGLAGFEPVSPQAPWQGTLAVLSPTARSEALRAAALFLALINLALVCQAVGFMSRNLSQADPALVWLWQFPVSRSVLFLSKLLESVFDTPFALASAMLTGPILWGCGCSFGVGLGLALLFGVSAAFAAAALRLIMEIWLLQKCSRKLRGAVVGAVPALGNLGLLFAMFCGNARVTTEIFPAIARLVPDWLFWNPFSFGFGTEAMADGIGSGWWLATPLLAVLLSAAAVWLAARLTARGLGGGQDTVRGSERPLRDIVRKPSLFAGLVWKELLQLRRQPERLAQVVLVVPLVLFMLYMAAPERSFNLMTRDAATICVSVFASAVYLLFVAANGMLTSELKMLWFLQCQPRPLADCIRTKARVWGLIAIAVSLPVLCWAVAARPAESAAILFRVPFLVASLWLLAEISFGLLSLTATVVHEQTVRFRRTAMLLPALIGSDVGVAIYSGDPWRQIVILVVLALLNIAVRQKQQFELSWLSEPVESPPPRLYAMHGLLAVLGFMFLQSLVAPILAQAGLSVAEVLSLSYVASALAVSLTTWAWLRRTGIEVLPQRAAGPVWRPLGLGLLVACFTGFAWVSVLRLTLGPAGWVYIDFASLAGVHGGAQRAWLTAGMIVLVAPLFEEWVFRGLLYQSLRRSRGVAASVVLTSLLFMAVHPMASSIPVLVLAVANALVVEKTGRLWPAMLIHAGFNLFVNVMWNLPMMG